MSFWKSTQCRVERFWRILFGITRPPPPSRFLQVVVLCVSASPEWRSSPYWEPFNFVNLKQRHSYSADFTGGVHISNTSWSSPLRGYSMQLTWVWKGCLAKDRLERRRAEQKKTYTPQWEGNLLFCFALAVFSTGGFKQSVCLYIEICFFWVSVRRPHQSQTSLLSAEL